jgi:hypothetical protein
MKDWQTYQSKDEINFHESNPSAPKDAGSFGRHILFEGMKHAATVCSRESFGSKKAYRVDGQVSLMPAKELLRYLKAKNLPMPKMIEKFWPEVGWEICWFDGEWV